MASRKGFAARAGRKRPARPVFASIVIPTRGRPELLGRALRGVLAQELGDWEAIVVDDGDGEGMETAGAFRDPRIEGHANAGKGQVDARSTGIARARGELLCWLDDDDWWEDAAHLSLLRAELGPGEFGFRGGFIVYGEGSGREGEREPFDFEASPSSLRSDNTILTSSIAYPRRAHRELGLLDRELGGYCDWDVLLRLCEAGYAPRKLPGLGVCYGVHGANVSGEVASAERRRGFERFVAKHSLAVALSSHLEIARAGGRAPGRASVG